MTVRFSAEARRQFLDAVDYISERDPPAAARFRRAVWALLRRLRRFPRMGRTVPEYYGAGYRELIHAPYRFFYRVHDKHVVVVAVWHGAQKPGNPDA